MRVGYFQFRPRFGQVEKNCDRVVNALGGADADLIVLPELAFTGYYFRNRAELRSMAEDPRRSTAVERLRDLCRERGFHLVAGFAEKDGDRLFNSALLIGPRGVVRTYRKLHLFNLEKRWFDPGDLPLEVHRVRGARVGMMICLDWVFPEVTRTLALEGMELLVHPSNLVLGHCQRVMVGRCIENAVFAVTANRYGKDARPHGSLRFTGKSQIVGPEGTVIARARSQREELSVCEIDPRRARNKRITPGNHLLRDRRPAFYRLD
jgi:predicted amidohydrolase